MPTAATVARGESANNLREGLRAIASTGGGVHLIHGDAGYGKTTLLQQLMEVAEEEGALVCHAVAHPLLAGTEYAPLVAALGPSVRARPEIARDLPSLGLLFDGLPSDHRKDDASVGGAGAGVGWGAARLFESVSTLISRLCLSTTVVLAVDDLHWADRSSLELLQFLLRDVPAHPFVMILTARLDEGEERGDVRSLLHGLDRRRYARRHELTPMDRSEVSAICVATWGPTADEIVDFVHRLSGGVPLLVDEYLRELEIGGLTSRSGGEVTLVSADLPTPRATRDLFSHRLAEIGPAGRRTLALLAFAAPSDALTDAQWWLSLLDVEQIPELERAGLVRSDRSQVQIRHAVIGELAFEQLTHSEQQRLIAELLELAPDDVIRARLLLHADAGIEVAGAWEVLLDAASRALERRAPAQAARLLSAALERSVDDRQRSRVHALLGRTWVERGENGLAAHQFDRALDLVGTADLPTRVGLFLDAAEARFRSGGERVDFTGLIAELEQFRAADLVAEVSYHALIDAARRGEQGPTSAAYAALARTPWTDRTALFRDVVDTIAEETARNVAVVLSRAPALAELTARCAQVPVLAERCIHTLSEDADLIGDVGGIDAAIAREQTLVGLNGWRAGLLYVERELATGGLDAAAEAAMRLDAVGPVLPLCLRARVEAARGNDEAAAATLQAAADLAVDLGHELLPQLTRLALDIGADASTARDVLARSEAEKGRIAMPSLVLLAHAHALDLVRSPELVPVVTSWRVETESGARSHLHAHAQLLAARELSEPGDRVTAYLAAAATFADLGRTFEAAVWVAEAVIALPHTREVSNADAVAAARTLAAAGAGPRVTRLGKALAQRGVSAARRTPRGIDRHGLTVREREVAELAADGASNREIADALFISVRTVTTHLDRVFAKVDVSSRTDLAAVLGDSPAHQAADAEGE